ncbi:hypothetical protein [Halodesulfovibrio aestuarii]|uniref:Uncharacterized protein n=1 Tax=Halodesulfovibrio aestuarii TaxID=126333 RepID=A0A8G2C7A8_9BACT|nr:hypothetical protein [Halodesulfovibrio aestuarii]SHI60536.1 hypothetical protein SAMN05660830_00436 [Halodesulfovibrio aestuarii]
MKRKGREHAPETVWKAQELYCVARLTFRDVANQAGVAESTVKRWADKHGWREKRERIARAECDIRADLVLARSEMIKSLMKKKDPQTGFAVASLENLAIKQAEFQREGLAAEIATHNEKRTISSAKDAVLVLREAIENKLSVLLASPEDVNFKSVADIQKALKLLTEMEAAHNVDQQEAPNKGMSADLAAKIREVL